MSKQSERLKQHNFTGKIRPVVEIISATSNPIGTLFSVWHGSRHLNTVRPKDIQSLYLEGEDQSLTTHIFGDDVADMICKDYPEHAGPGNDDYKNVILRVNQQVIETDVPAGESVNFVIEIDSANVAWREQLVRSKVASYWTQSTRTIDMRTMDVNMSDSVEIFGGQEGVERYKYTVDTIRETYRILVDLGVPVEDIRLQPQGHVHRVYWMISLRSLVKILNKRSDWIAQASLWSPIVAGILFEIRDNPDLKGLIDILQKSIGKPPVEVAYNEKLGHHSVVGYIMNADNEDRYYGRDPLPCDPLWLAYKGLRPPEHTDFGFYDYLKSLFIQIWSDEYLDALGWDRHDPTKLGRYDRP